MRAPETFMRTDSEAVSGRDGPVNLWADSFGAAAAQLGLVLTLAIAAHYASSLLIGR
jgi:hypothetical protein